MLQCFEDKKSHHRCRYSWSLGGTGSPGCGGGIVSGAKVCREGGVCFCWYQALGWNSPLQAEASHLLQAQLAASIHFSSILKEFSFFSPNMFNESSMILTSSHRISVRTGEQWFYIPRGAAAALAANRSHRGFHSKCKAAVYWKCGINVWVYFWPLP